jgi:hypothetical protein
MGYGSVGLAGLAVLLHAVTSTGGTFEGGAGFDLIERMGLGFLAFLVGGVAGLIAGLVINSR